MIFIIIQLLSNVFTSKIQAEKEAFEEAEKVRRVKEEEVNTMSKIVSLTL